MCEGFCIRVAGEAELRDCWFVDDAGMRRWLERFSGREGLRIRTIGRSREGRDLYGISVGAGRKIVTITAGAHADEPAGPMTAMLLADWLSSSEAPVARELRELATFIICPQVNPDGSEANKGWFSAVPDFGRYVRHVRRELPGDDVEFGYPGDGKGALRPENQAVVDYLSDFGAADAHFSLHSMGFAGGAWFLLGEAAVAHSNGLMERLVVKAAREGFDLHDIERNGEKGFRRLAPGFCTTPDSRAMAEHFRGLGDEAMAEKFHFSSMEWTLERNPEAVVLVTEVPVFALRGGFDEARRGVTDASKVREGWEMQERREEWLLRGWGLREAPVPGGTAYEEFRERLKGVVAAGDFEGAVDLAAGFGVVSVPFEAQCRLMVEAVVVGVGVLHDC